LILSVFQSFFFHSTLISKQELKKLKEMEKEDRKLENERRLKRHSRPLDKPLETGIRPIDVSSALSEIVGTAASSPQAKDRIKNVLQVRFSF
jgi:hypothetical protein